MRTCDYLEGFRIGGKHFALKVKVFKAGTDVAVRNRR